MTNCASCDLEDFETDYQEKQQNKTKGSIWHHTNNSLTDNHKQKITPKLNVRAE